MRQYAWYCIELDAICLRTIMEDCWIAFEWDCQELFWLNQTYGTDVEPTDLFTFIPLGEL